MKLIIGLGNPGAKYKDTWHNLGFIAIDQLQKNNQFPAFKLSEKFKAELSEGALGDEKVILAKPQTFMNESGQAVQTLTRFYKIKPEDILVVHDELDLPMGKIRLSQNASAAGHNGIKSLETMLGSKQFIRFRIGIKPSVDTKISATDYVLQKISKDSKVLTNQALGQAEQAILVTINRGLDQAMNQFN